jgi:hypothetical protein
LHCGRALLLLLLLLSLSLGLLLLLLLLLACTCHQDCHTCRQQLAYPQHHQLCLLLCNHLLLQVVMVAVSSAPQGTAASP